MWIYLGLLSAFFLGLYDVCRKSSLKNNSVIPVLFIATLSGACLITLLLPLGCFFPQQMKQVGLLPQSLSLTQHLFIVIKSITVGGSWIFAYIAMRRLPLSIVAPIYASSPLWTLLGAVIFFGEKLNTMQWCGIILVFISYYLFSIIGKLENISFARNKLVYCVFVSSLIAAFCSLYDKFLIQKLSLNPLSVQIYYFIYLTVIFGVIYLFIRKKNYAPDNQIHFSLSIPLIGILLTFSDLAYFKALSYSDALISVLSSIRSSNVIIAFALGVIIFKEANKLKKSFALAGILTGIILILNS